MGNKNVWNWEGAGMTGGKARGISTSISVVLLMVALLFLVSSIAHYSNMARDSSSMLAQISNVQEQFDSASYGARRLAGEYGMEVSLNGSNATVEQDLSALETYRQSIVWWGKFLNFTYRDNSTTMEAGSALQEAVVYPQNASVRMMDAGCSEFERCAFFAPGTAEIIQYNLTVNVAGSPVYVNATQPDWVTCNDETLALVVKAIGYGSESSAKVCMNRWEVNANNLSIEAGSVVARVRLNGTGHLEFDYLPERNTYLTLVAELDSTPLYIGRVGPAAKASSGAVAKQGNVYDE